MASGINSSKKVKFKSRNNRLDFIINILNKTSNYLEAKKKVLREGLLIEYDSLAPTLIDKKKVKTYLDAIYQAVENENIKNIGITGTYGSGKSSILNTFKKEFPNYKYLNISLATFSQTKGEEEKKELEKSLELSIVQQIFYHVKSKEIPDSRFKRINSISKNIVLGFSISFIIWFLSIAILFDFKFLSNLEISFLNKPYIKYLSVGIFLFGILLLCRKVIRILNNSKLNKLNVQSGEIELNKGSEQSILNKYLDEILYFFEVTKHNVVIIEDIDRFKNTQIFKKLREINLLINNSDQILKQVTFIYAVRDELFINGDRTKFFDFIIPVIPFINPYNASELLLKKIDKVELGTKPTEKFINEVSSFIVEMRVLINVYNEYIIYRNNLSPSLDQDKLLAMIIYKNMHPDDFSLLHKNQGFVADILSNKNEYLNIISKDNDLKIKKIEGVINGMSNEKNKDITELRSIYLQAFLKKLPDFKSIKINKIDYSLSDLNSDSLFDELINATTINYKYYSVHSNQHSQINNSSIPFSFSEIEKLVNPVKSYKYRENLILKKLGNEIEVLNEKMDSLKKHRKKIYLLDLKDIINEIDIDDFVNNELNIDKKLILYLIREGYLNENYYDYISYFHVGSISQSDNEFIQCVKSGCSLDYEYNLNYIDNIINKIDTRFFNREQILNKHLIDHLLRNKENYPEKASNVIELLCDGRESTIDFIYKYIEFGEEQGILINSISYMWSSFWNVIEFNYKNQPTKIDIFSKNILMFSDINDIQNLGNNSNLTSYLTDKKDFLSFIPDIKYASKIEQIISGLNIKFNNLLTPKENELELFNFIYEGNYYAINKYMLELILKQYSEGFSEDKFGKSNYTLIKESSCNFLISYLEKNINTYINNIFFLIETNNAESEESIISLLNNPNISDEDRDKIIDKQNTQILEIQKIEDTSLLKNLFEESKVIATWVNVISYYKYREESFDDILTDYLNISTNYFNLSGEIIELRDEESEYIEEFTKNILLNDSLSDTSYLELITSTTFMWGKLEFESLSKEKVNGLVTNELLLLNSFNIEKLKIYFSNLHIKLIEINIKSFMENINDFELDNSDILKILKSELINKTNKIIIFERFIDLDLLIKEQETIDLVSSFVVELPYDDLNKKNVLVLIKYTSSVITKVELLNLYFDSICVTITDARLILTSYPKPYNQIMKKRKRPTLESNYFNIELVKKLKEKKFISSFEANDVEINVVANY